MTIKANLLKLNVGCGPHYADGWVNIDRYDQDEIQDGRRVDVVCDVLALPFDADAFSHAYAGHFLEHLGYEDEAPLALREIHRVLAPDGQLMVVVPDVQRAREGWPGMLAAIEPKPGDELLPAGIPHKWAPTAETTLALCRSVFASAEELPIADVASPWPLVDPVGWQSAIRCLP